MQNYQIALKVAEVCVDDENEQEINQKEQEQPSVPVSYTHLDVYKRQIPSSGNVV